MFFVHLDERNAMMKTVTHFDNFTKWTFFVVNRLIEKSLMTIEEGVMKIQSLIFNLELVVGDLFSGACNRAATQEIQWPPETSYPWRLAALNSNG
jgi:hypothetical protein